jgi:cobalt/nickel transport system permease protein
MTLAFRDPSVPDSPLARWDARWKLAALLLAVAATVSLHQVGPAAAAFAAALGLAALGRVPPGAVAGRVGLLLLGVAPLLIFVPFTAGVAEAAVLTLRVLAVGLLALVLTRTAPLARTFAAAHCLWLPGVLVQVAQLAYRYTFLLAAEARRTRVALRSRGFQAGTNRHTYRTLGYAVGALLVRSGDRAERVSDAMRCRGFDGTYHSVAEFRTTTADVIGFVLVAAGAAALVLADRVP